MTGTINVEVVFALPGKQRLVQVTLEQPATVQDAVQQSGLQKVFADIRLDALETGVWGHIVPRSTVLNDGDRVELYRPLERDPREARRLLAEHQSLGSSS